MSRLALLLCRAGRSGKRNRPSVSYPTSRCCTSASSCRIRRRDRRLNANPSFTRNDAFVKFLDVFVVVEVVLQDVVMSPPKYATSVPVRMRRYISETAEVRVNRGSAWIIFAPPPDPRPLAGSRLAS